MSERRRAAAIAHDFRAPLNAIRGFAEMLRLKGESISPERRAEYLDNIISAADRMDALADRFVAEGAPGPCDLTRLARAAAVLRGAAVEATEPLATEGDAVSVSRILDNLIDNALTHGGCARVRVGRKGGAPCVEVWDEGPGMSAAALSAALTPHSRGAAGGLGLPNCIALAETMGARLEFETAPGEGLLARLLFPEQPGDAGIGERAQP